jgi:3-oxoacyl-[acyl-carrier protein] reductase
MNLTVGQKTRRSITLTSEQVAAYAKLTGDHNPLHFDLAFAKRTGKLDGLIVQWLTTSLLRSSRPTCQGRGRCS